MNNNTAFINIRIYSEFNNVNKYNFGKFTANYHEQTINNSIFTTYQQKVKVLKFLHGLCRFQKLLLLATQSRHVSLFLCKSFVTSCLHISNIKMINTRKLLHMAPLSLNKFEILV